MNRYANNLITNVSNFMALMRSYANKVISYVSYFFILYVAICLALGTVAVIVGVLAVAVLGFGFGMDLRSDETDSLGPIGMGMSIGFVVALPLALAATIWTALSRFSLDRDLQQHMGGTSNRGQERMDMWNA
jgi:hypothetical protein